MQDFRNLRAWQAAHEFVLATYRTTASFPASERFGLTSQVRRAAVSVPTNIVEGSKRRTRNDFAYFLNIAQASLAEATYLLFLAEQLGFLPSVEYEKLGPSADRLARMLAQLRRRVEQNDWTPSDPEDAPRG